jgi:hypothetical protein
MDESDKTPVGPESQNLNEIQAELASLLADMTSAPGDEAQLIDASLGKFWGSLSRARARAQDASLSVAVLALAKSGESGFWGLEGAAGAFRSCLHLMHPTKPNQTSTQSVQALLSKHTRVMFLMWQQRRRRITLTKQGLTCCILIMLPKCRQEYSAECTTGSRGATHEQCARDCSHLQNHSYTSESRLRAGCWALILAVWQNLILMCCHDRLRMSFHAHLCNIGFEGASA